MRPTLWFYLGVYAKSYLMINLIFYLKNSLKIKAHLLFYLNVYLKSNLA